MSVQDLVSKYNGTIFGITGPDQGQCTAVAHAWEQMLGLGIVYGNAKDTYANADPAVYDKVLNIPGDLNNFPPAGAIVVWDSKWGGGYGHIAVVVSADGNTMQVLEQNDGDNGITHVGQHNYQDVLGWFIPKILEQSNEEVAMNAQQETQAYEIILNREPDIAVPSGRTGLQFILDAQAELAQQRANTASTLTGLQSQIDALNSDKQNLANQVADESKQVQDLTIQVKSQADTITQLNAKPATVPVTVSVNTPVDSFLAGPTGKLMLQLIGVVVGFATPYITNIPFPPDVAALIGAVLGHFASNKAAK
jgi:surface antigen